ncbi:MAG: histidine phosphatase family protein [Pseudomonadota bacterium]
MKTLAILRHAKSDWSDGQTRDFDRPLNARGIKGATVMGAYIKANHMQFDAVVASPAARVTETLEHVESQLDSKFTTQWDRRIYLASSATLLELLREQDDAASVLMIAGHNPGLEDLILELLPDDGSSPMRDQVETKFPTGALAILKTDIDAWQDLGSAPAQLELLVRPRDIDPELGPEVRH